MTSNDIHLLDEPITIKDYSIYNNDSLPKLLLGFSLKNKFDEKRIRIKSEYNPKRISHFKWTSELEPMFAYGIEIVPKKKYKPLLNHLEKASLTLHSNSFDDYVTKYKNTLNKYNLTCNDCYRYLSDGVYPIDVEHFTDMSKKNYSKEVNSGFRDMIEDSDQPWYMTVPNFKLFVLTWSAGYGLDYEINK